MEEIHSEEDGTMHQQPHKRLRMHIMRRNYMQVKKNIPIKNRIIDAFRSQKTEEPLFLETRDSGNGSRDIYIGSDTWINSWAWYFLNLKSAGFVAEIAELFWGDQLPFRCQSLAESTINLEGLKEFTPRKLRNVIRLYNFHLQCKVKEGAINNKDVYIQLRSVFKKLRDKVQDARRRLFDD